MEFRKKILTLLICTSACLIAQNKSEFNQAEAISWLNNKMLDASRYVDASSYMICTNPKFSYCHFSDVVQVKDYGTLLMTNTYDVDLKKLNPASIKLMSYKTAFYYDVSTTNSESSIPCYKFDAGETPAIYSYGSFIHIGPFEMGKDLEARVKNVLIKVITKCGGKKDTF